MGRLLAEFDADHNTILIVIDCGFAVLDALTERYPSRVLNVGSREQLAVGLAAGLATAGAKPYVYSIASFLIYRALEQIRLDVIETGLPVKLIGYGAGDRFKELGPSHVVPEKQDFRLLGMLGLRCFPAAHSKAFIEFDGPAYLRVP